MSGIEEQDVLLLVVLPKLTPTTSTTQSDIDSIKLTLLENECKGFLGVSNTDNNGVIVILEQSIKDTPDETLITELLENLGYEIIGRLTHRQS